MNTTQPERRIHISELCARVFRQHEQECGTPPGASEATKNIGAARRNYFGDESQTDSNFDDAAAEAEWLSKWSHQQPDIHLDSIAPDDGVYEGFDDRARPIDSVPAYLAERSGISYQDAVDYIHRARFGCQWGKLKRASDDVWPDITAIARIVSAYFQGDAMRELIAWFVKEYPHEATEMGLPDSDVEQSLRGQDGQGSLTRIRPMLATCQSIWPEWSPRKRIPTTNGHPTMDFISVRSISPIRARCTV